MNDTRQNLNAAAVFAAFGEAVEDMRAKSAESVDLFVKSLPHGEAVPNVETPVVLDVVRAIVHGTMQGLESTIKALPISIDEMVALREAIRTHSLAEFTGGYCFAQAIARRRSVPRPGFRPPVGRKQKPH